MKHLFRIFGIALVRTRDSIKSLFNLELDNEGNFKISSRWKKSWIQIRHILPGEFKIGIQLNIKKKNWDRERKNSAPPKMHTREGGYKETSFGVCPPAPYESSFHQGQIHAISNFKRGLCPTAPHTSELYHYRIRETFEKTGQEHISL